MKHDWKLRKLLMTVLVLAAVLLAASALSRSLMESTREPEAYDPRGGPLAIDGIWIGMTWREVACVTGLRPQERLYTFRSPGSPVDTRIAFHVPPPEGSLQDATVFSVGGRVLTQDGRVLVDFRSVSRNNPSRARDVFAALGQSSWGAMNGYWYYFLADSDLTLIVTEYTGMRGSAPPELDPEDYDLIRLELAPTRPDPEGSPKP